MTGMLTGIRVLDLSRVLAGPWATQIFADYGADVVKVERPGAGDDTRKFGPPWITDETTGEIVDAAYYASANRGKRSLTLDIATPDGQEIARKLAAQSDILIENYKVGALAKYGLDYAAIQAVNPRIVYCSITGFGQTGPYRNRAGYDFLIQGMGGLMSVTGERDDLPGGGPQRAGVALADILCGMYATSAILAALYRRARTGQGEYIDLALLDAQVATLANQGMNYLIGGTAPKRFGNGHPNIVPYQAFATADGHVILAVGNDEQYARFCAVAGRPELATDPKYVTIAQRNAHRDELIPEARRRAAAVAVRRVDREARGGERALRPDQHDRQGVRGSAGAGARHARRPAASARGHAAVDRQPGALRQRPRSNTRTRRPCSASTPTKCWRTCWDSTPTRARRCARGA